MRPQFSGPEGDCFRACVATITGLDAITMPNFMFADGVSSEAEGLDLTRDWLEPRGLTIFDTWLPGNLPLDRVLRDCSAYNPGVPIILAGKAEYSPEHHNVVVMNGAIIHDPSGAGISGPSECACGAEGCQETHWGLKIILPAISNMEPGK